MSGTPWIILADDHTGACDAAAPFARAAAPVPVYFDPARWQPGPPVTAISFDCRRLPSPQTAGALVRAWFAQAGPGLRGRLFVKIDSTLAPGSGIFAGAVLDALGNPPALLTPANPSQGRVVSQGQLFVNGAPAGIALTAWVRTHLPGASLQLPDASSPAELDLLVRETPPETLLCGSAGLAAAIARTLPPAADSPTVAAVREIFVFVGSQQAISLEQAAVLQQAALPGVSVRHVAREHPHRACDGLTPQWLGPRRAIVLVGGDTAAALTRYFQIPSVALLGELLPGIVYSEAPAGGYVVTKPGGFGDPAALLQAVQALMLPPVKI